MKKKIILGVCPIGKFVFSHEDAMRQKKMIVDKLNEWNVDYCLVDAVIPDGMLRDHKHVAPVVEHFKKNKVDALFMPHCNFGTESAVGMIGKKLGVPVLLWGPRDEAPLPDGSRLRDSLCGLFASSKVLTKLKVPFTYINNCEVDHPEFKKGLDLFLRAATVVKAMRNMRIAQIGVRIDFFWTTIDNESELLEKFDIEILPFDMADFLRDVKARTKLNRSKYVKELSQYKHLFSDPKVLEMEGTIQSMGMRDLLLEIAEKEGIDAFSIKSFDSIQSELGDGLDLGCKLVEEHYPIAVESDIHGAISTCLLQAASSVDESAFFPEFTIRHPENNNAVLLWHDAAILELRKDKINPMKCYSPWILKDLPGKYSQMLLKDGPLTVCRFDGDTNDYRLGVGEGKTVDGPVTKETYVWMEVDDWSTWERRLIEGPYIHHCSAIYDNCADALVEACKYIPHLKAERFDRS